MAQTGPQDRLELMEKTALMVKLELKVYKGKQGPLGHKGFKAWLVLRDP